MMIGRFLQARTTRQHTTERLWRTWRDVDSLMLVVWGELERVPPKYKRIVDIRMLQRATGDSQVNLSLFLESHKQEGQQGPRKDTPKQLGGHAWGTFHVDTRSLLAAKQELNGFAYGPCQ